MNNLGRANIQVSGQKRSVLDMARSRLMLLSLFFILTYIVVAARIVDLWTGKNTFIYSSHIYSISVTRSFLSSVLSVIVTPFNSSEGCKSSYVA